MYFLDRQRNLSELPEWEPGFVRAATVNWPQDNNQNGTNSYLFASLVTSRPWQVICHRSGAMDVSYVTAFAALGGAALGGFTSFASSWTTLRVQMRAQAIATSKSRRQKLYKKFIEEATIHYGDALIHNTLELSGLIGMYALISKMRVISSPPVIESAVRVVRVITDTYRQPNKTPAELDLMIHDGSVDFLKDFSDACREEFESHS